ncbi:M20/M25/M40 family metallo-hydrolase [Mucilaginibacter segetis]|uniref:M20/M25/M40 family metallo-hydrolase n=1 Tax=Mucilaginibacter segetis TaxID=2793071 RepID=A0A934UNA0_9SPHI|nr:M20/M25/M40 family metallo-hydrolase [Mucilaginibacter segetis]MBK0379855.1 M20/M25/M40 family metallo-hydrolase [Mucilaginibacter segetis]
MKKYLVSAAFLALSVCSFAQDVNKMIKADDVDRIIKTLSADDMQGRATFSPGIDKAATFIEGEFKAAGLQPLAGATGFRQNFSMTRTTPVNPKVVFDGVAIPEENVSVSAGSSFSWNNDSDVQMITIADMANFRKEYSAAMRSGKKSLILLDTALTSIFKQIHARGIEGRVSAKVNDAPPVVFVLASTSPKSFQVSCEVRSQELPLFNVAGMIPGKTKPDEYVVFSGHYDHLGIVKPVEGDSIANGADDDASGTTAVISLAKYYKKLNNNARTLIFVAFTAEEIGGYGSQYFSKQLDPDKVVAMFNIEMIGKDSKFGDNSAFITGYERSDFGKILQKNLEGTAFKFYPDPYPAQNLFYRSDNATLARLGVPAHTISTDQIDVDKHYHHVTDEYSTLDVKNIIATIRAIALSSRTIVSGEDTPTRVGKLER